MMMVAQVLVKSYSGNLMSGLAVRHIKQPYQTLRHLLDDSSAIMIWLSNSPNVEFFRTVQFGIYHEVSEAGSRGRMEYSNTYEFLHNAAALLSDGHHALVGNEILVDMIISKEFSHTGSCDYYSSRERLLPNIMASVGQKKSPLVPALSKRILTLTEFGLYNQWLKASIPNSTSCANLPTKITISSTLSLDNLRGIFVVLACGLVLSGVCLCVEVTSRRLPQFCSSHRTSVGL
nr:uncharacterized protein LOC123754236 [Procambarus clarkii]